MCVHFVVVRAFAAVGHQTLRYVFHEKRLFTGLRTLDDEKKRAVEKHTQEEENIQ